MTAVLPSVTDPALTETDQLLAARLKELLGDEAVSTRPLDLHAHAHDASHYLLFPKTFVRPNDAEQVAATMREATAAGRPLTFRSGGSSLSGQALSDSVMADTREAFREVEVLEGGKAVRVQPGVTVALVNAHLRRHGYKLGPDPASSTACTIGGVVANNSSGMHCGTTENTYRTLRSAKFVLPSGTLIDSSLPGASQALREAEPELFEGLLRLRKRILDNPNSVARIQHLFSMKNTMGYGINSFLDFEDPLDILVHLLIGSEGTLAFIAEATFNTVPIAPFVSTGLVVVDGSVTAASLVPGLLETGTKTAELMDSRSLAVAARLPATPQQIRDLDTASSAALLIEYTAQSEEELRDTLGAAGDFLKTLPLKTPMSMTEDAKERADLWATRNGLYAAIAGDRPSGVSQLLEDICVPVESLGSTCDGLSSLFAEHHYDDAVIFGHAKDGNVHFMLQERFDQDMSRYEAFTEDMVSLVLDGGGTLKAEHGTGRIMASYVRREYGDELYEVMQQVKSLCDPSGTLNPGSVLSDDPRAYLQNLKPAPTVEEEVDRCVECGYCEPVCPSRHLTLTPRQRIVLRRDAEQLRSEGRYAEAEELMQGYAYEGIDTCAVDGMCSTACPVDINTGDLVRRLRAENDNRLVAAGWKGMAHAWGVGGVAAGAALSVAKVVPGPAQLVTDLLRKALPTDLMPAYTADLPGGGRRRPTLDAPTPQAVFFPACIGTMFAPTSGGDVVAGEGGCACGSGGCGSTRGDAAPSGTELPFHEGGSTGSLAELCARAGVGLRTPEGLAGLCCGTPWKSKGFTEGWDVMRKKVLTALLAASDGGRLPVIIDASSCTEGVKVMMENIHGRTPDQVVAGAGKLVIEDSLTFVAREVMPRLSVSQPLKNLALHPNCSSMIQGSDQDLLSLAQAICDDVVVPIGHGCCGFAGDRGMLHPELTESATRDEIGSLREEEAARGGAFAHYASSNRTCEIGMERASGRPYRNILELVEVATR